MLYKELFSILAKVDSTNNYAMAKVHEGLAKHGSAWFAMDQTAGKGQRGKTWNSLPGSSIILSIVARPSEGIMPGYFPFSALVSLEVLKYCESLGGDEWSLKWPNDIYWRDRKAGGILIENIIRGKEWSWSVIGIGINMNQGSFDPDLPNPVSLREITGKNYDVALEAGVLHVRIMDAIDNFSPGREQETLETYNRKLYKRGEVASLTRDGVPMMARIAGVDKEGCLLTSEGRFEWGTIAWNVVAS